jgi:hypothetical protein
MYAVLLVFAGYALVCALDWIRKRRSVLGVRKAASERLA